MKAFLQTLIAMLAVTLVGCTYRQAEIVHPAGIWSNYRCVAVNVRTGHRWYGWATTEEGARMSALDKCAAHSRIRNCYILRCRVR